MINKRVIRCEDMRPSSHQVNREKANPSLLGLLDKTMEFKDKVELIRAVNPYFYLLTPKPKKIKGKK